MFTSKSKVIEELDKVALYNESSKNDEIVDDGVNVGSCDNVIKVNTSFCSK